MADFPFKIKLSAIDQVSVPLQKIAKNIESLNGPLKKVQGSFRGMAMRVKDQMTKLGDATAQFKKGLGNVRSGIFGFGGALVAAGGMIGLFAKKAGDLEQVEIAFETMLGSGEKAQALIQDITKFAASTPFELTGLLDTSKTMLAFGFQSDQIVEKLNVLGNIAAGVGQDRLPNITRAFGKIRSKGKASMEELNILIEAGVPILDALSKGLGVSTAKVVELSSKGKISFDFVDQALASLATGNGMFAGLMVKQSKTFMGLMSNIGDSLNMLAVSIGKDLLPALMPLAEEFLKMLSNEENIKAFKGTVVGFFKGFIDVLKIILPYLKNVETNLFVLKAIGLIFAGVMTNKIVVGLMQMSVGVYKVGAAFTDFSLRLASAFSVLMANPIGLVILAVAALAAIAYLVIKNWDKVKSFFIKMWDSPITKILALLNPVTALLSLGTAIIKRFSEVRDIFSSLFSGDFKKFLGQSFNFGKNILGDVTGGIFGGGNNTAPTASSVAPNMVNRTTTNNAAVSVDFRNVPQGAQISPVQNDGVLNLNTGFAAVPQ